MVEFQNSVNDCWNKVGIRAGSKCEQLLEYLHCRNCPSYSEAARDIMRRPVSMQYRKEWATHFALADEDSRPANESAIVFRIGHEWLALPTHMFVTVAEATSAHRLPHRNDRGLLGVVNVGGKLYPCIALSELMSIDAVQPYVQSGRHAYPRLIVVRPGRQAVAFPVHDVHGIVRYRSDEVLASPSTGARNLSHYLAGVLGVGDKQAGFLDAELLGNSIAEILR